MAATYTAFSLKKDELLSPSFHHHHQHVIIIIIIIIRASFYTS